MTTDRRGFLRTAALAAILPAPPLVERPIPAIDTHTHFYDPRRRQGVPWPSPKETILYKPHYPADFVSLTRDHGVVGTVVVEASPWVEDNQWILDLAARNDSIVGFIGNLRPGQSEFGNQLKRFAANPIFRGLRLGEQSMLEGIGNAQFERDLQMLGERGLTLDVVGSAGMLGAVEKAARLAPAMSVVIDHLPFPVWDDNPAEMKRRLSPLAALPNVRVKVSHVVRRVDGRTITGLEPYRARLDALWEIFGGDRLIFGSNWPVSNLFGSYANLHAVVAAWIDERGRAAAERFFWRNSLDAYRWVARGKARRLA